MAQAFCVTYIHKWVSIDHGGGSHSQKIYILVAQTRTKPNHITILVGRSGTSLPPASPLQYLLHSFYPLATIVCIDY